jgi:hypothetical protein
MEFFKKNKYLLYVIAFGIGLFFLASSPNDYRSEVTRLLLAPHMSTGDVDDSINKEYRTYYYKLNEMQAIKRRQLDPWSAGWEMDMFGVAKVIECDTCTTMESFAHHKGSPKYFLSFKNYTLRQEAGFFIKNGKYFITYPVYENGSYSSSEINKKEVKVRFSSSSVEFTKAKTALLIPTSRNVYNMVNFVFPILYVPIALILSWIIFILPFRTLFRIAVGDFFNPRNVNDLRLAGWTLLIFILSPIFISFLIKLFLGSSLPKEIYFPWKLYLFDNKEWLVGAFSLLILSSAFKAGSKLKEEQALTI